MKTQLVEFINCEGNIVRGILTGKETAKRGVLMLPGYERAASTEPKFKRLAEMLDRPNIASLRLDFSGCGLSDGTLSENNIVSYADEVASALRLLRGMGLEQFCVVAHSFSACTVAFLSFIEQKIEFDWIVLIAPALNQRELQRYWFVRNIMRKRNRLFRVTWQNYRSLLDEDAFKNDCARTDKMTGKNFVGAKFSLENMGRDYQEGILPLLGKTLLIHGNRDEIVPLESFTIDFPKQYIVSGGDHELERPDMASLWLSHAVSFLTQ